MKSFTTYLKESAMIESIGSLAPLDETESIHLDLTDELLKQSKIAAYNVNQVLQDENGKDIPINPKKFPDKAISILIPLGDTSIEIFFRTKNLKWDSRLTFNNVEGKLSPEQMGQFFNSEFYKMLLEKLSKHWPLSDDFYNGLYDGLLEKAMYVGGEEDQIEEDDEEHPGHVHTDLDHDGKDDFPKFSPSGRKIIHFSNIGVNTRSARFFCWPNLDKIYRWSTWKDYTKIKPLCRLRFKYVNGKEYGMTLSVIDDQYDHRGFRAYDLTTEPHLQWLTKNECADFIELDIVKKFVKHCADKIEKYLELDPEEIYAKINNPDKITVDEIRQTQKYIKNTLRSIVKTRQLDDFTWK